MSLRTAIEKIATSMAIVASVENLPSPREVFTADQVAGEGFFLPVDLEFDLSYGDSPVRLPDTPLGSVARIFAEIHLDRSRLPGTDLEVKRDMADKVEAIRAQLETDSVNGVFKPLRIYLEGGGIGFIEEYEYAIIDLRFVAQAWH